MATPGIPVKDEGSDHDAYFIMRPVVHGKSLSVTKTGDTAASRPFNAYDESRDGEESGRGEQPVVGVTTRSFNASTEPQEDDEHILDEQPVAGVTKRSVIT